MPFGCPYLPTDVLTGRGGWRHAIVGHRCFTPLHNHELSFSIDLLGAVDDDISYR